MKYVIILSIIFASCGNKHWVKRGLKKGWLDTATVVSDTLIPVVHDTVYMDSITEVFLKELDTLFLSDTIVLTPEVRYRVKEKLKVVYVPKERPFQPFTHVTDKGTEITVYPQGGEVRLLVKEKTCEITVHNKWYDFWWLILVGVAIGVIFMAWIRK